MNWEAIDIESYLRSLGNRSSFFFQPILENYLIFLFEDEFTFLLVLRVENERLIVSCIKKITSQRNIIKITGNNDCILMLDVEDELFLLQGTLRGMSETFDVNNAEKFLNADGVLWWQKQQQLKKCLAVTGISNAISILHQDELVYATIYQTHDLKNGLHKVSQDFVTYFKEGCKYVTAKLNGEIAKIIGERIIKSLTLVKEIILVIDPTQILFLLPTPEGQIISQPYEIDFQTDIVINVMTFEKQNWIIIVCESGKLVTLRFDNCTRSFQMRHAWLPNPVAAIVGYEDGNIFLLWSDLNKLYLSTLDDNNVLRNIKVFYNTRHVRHLVRIDDNILVITIDGCLYRSKIRLTSDQEIQSSTSELLNKMFYNSKITEKLIKEVVAKEHLLEAVNISRKHNIISCINITKKEDTITLKNTSKYLFRKKLWRLWLERKNFQNRHFEMRELDDDISPGGSISVKYGEKIPDGLFLVCDILDKPLSITLEFKYEENIHESENHLTGIEEYLKDKCAFVA